MYKNSKENAELSIPEAALNGSLRDFKSPSGTDLLERVSGFFEWQDLRRQHNLWPYARSTSSAPKTHCSAKTDRGEEIQGVNFASQDYLSLASHPEIKEAAIERGARIWRAQRRLGRAARQHTPFAQSRKAISEFIGGREIVLYPTGWSAGFAAVQGFVRPTDHVVMDVLAHSCLQEGARAATQNIHFHGHLNIEGAGAPACSEFARPTRKTAFWW